MVSLESGQKRCQKLCKVLIPSAGSCRLQVQPAWGGCARRQMDQKLISPCETKGAPSKMEDLADGTQGIKPVIAAVNGIAHGGGFETALACDVIIACDDSDFALPEPKVGLFAGAAGVLRLPRARRRRARVLRVLRVPRALAIPIPPPIPLPPPPPSSRRRQPR